MIIKKYRCQRFAGIKDKCIDFQAGINVLLGENESGKSTLIEGIHAAMFKSIKYDRRSAADKDFYSRFMPLPVGDVIDSELVLTGDGGEFTLTKVWGENSSVQLITPQGNRIISEENINEVLKEILMFGEGTFSNILFSKQAHIREALQRITASRETTSEVSTLLRKAIMELDGVSIDDLGHEIDTEIEKLLKRWDLDRGYPENNRGINNPYKTGIGTVLTCYYIKEQLLRDMEDAKIKQQQFDDIYLQLKIVEEQILALKQQKEILEKIEDDVIKRSQLEPKIAQYEKDQAVLMKINQEWPKNETRLEQVEKELSAVGNEYAQLEQEKKQVAKAQEKAALQSKLKQLNELQQQLEMEQIQAQAVKEVTQDDINNLEAYDQAMRNARAKMQAGVMIGKLAYFSGKTGLIITRDLEEPVLIETGDTFQANGFIKLESDLVSLEIKSGDMDFVELRKEYEVNQRTLTEYLRKLAVDSVAAARLNKEKLERSKNNISHLTTQITNLLGGDTYEDLVSKLQGYGDLNNIRNLADIETALKALDDKKIELLASKKSLEGIIAEWCETYRDINGLLEKLVEIKIAGHKDIVEINNLVPLPDQFDNAEQFRRELGNLRKVYEEEQGSLLKLREAYYKCEQELPETPYEDLQEELKQAEEKFAHSLDKAHKLQKVKTAFENTRAAIDGNSFKPVAEAFSQYVVLLTNGNFKSGGIDNSFQLRLEKENNTDIPIDLLSTGTYDSVALALRLALLEYIFDENQNFMILDDCLVDLDPVRKQNAAALIKKFAARHQVIFTTCDPATADLLGGNIIHM